MSDERLSCKACPKLIWITNTCFNLFTLTKWEVFFENQIVSYLNKKFAVLSLNTIHIPSTLLYILRGRFWDSFNIISTSIQVHQKVSSYQNFQSAFCVAFSAPHVRFIPKHIHLDDSLHSCYSHPITPSLLGPCIFLIPLLSKNLDFYSSLKA